MKDVAYEIFIIFHIPGIKEMSRMVVIKMKWTT